MKQKSNFGQIRCQRCAASNALGEELCQQCGTRLMLVVVPQSLRFEDDETPNAAHSEHLLERVSILENRLSRITDHLQRTLDLIYRQTRSIETQSEIVNTIISLLIEAKVFERGEFQKRWEARATEEDAADAEVDPETMRRTLFRVRIHRVYEGSDAKAFGDIVDQGFQLLSKGNVAGGTGQLEKAAALAPNNKPLHSFLGHHFFQKGKSRLAKDYLAKAVAGDDCSYGNCLLLGLLHTDDNETEHAIELLKKSVDEDGASFAAHSVLGLASAAKGEWNAALVEFRRALKARSCAEAYYLVAFACFQLKRYRLSARYLDKTTEADANYPEAWYMLGLVCGREGNREAAIEAFDQALAAAESKDARYQTAKNTLRDGARVDLDLLPPPAPLFSPAKRSAKGLLARCDKRLVTAVRSDALEQVARALTREQ